MRRVGASRARTEVLAVSQEASTCGDGGGAQPDAYLPNLAGSVSNHAEFLARLGRVEALTGVTGSRRLVPELVEMLSRDAYLPNLAGSVNNHAASLARRGAR
jgi:hypothetical protein